jgi:transcriptional regulator with XRE-family HTH domain
VIEQGPKTDATEQRAENGQRTDADAAWFGRRLRQLRLERSMIASNLAASAGISSSFLSQIERGRASPSFRVLEAIARALDLPTSALLDREEPGGDADARRRPGTHAQRALVPTVVRRGERKRLRAARGPEYELLSPDLTGEIEFVWYRLETGQESPVAVSHEGEEQLLVLAGEVTLEIGGAEHHLGAGDSIRFDSSAPHRAVNRGDGPAEIVSAGTPPSF